MCSGHGTCDVFGTGCNCINTHWGAHCENECACSDHGHCDSTGQCTCENGYFGETCTTYCNQEYTCHNNGHCSDAGTCICATGYLGSECGLSGAVLGVTIGVVSLAGAIIAVFFIRECRKYNKKKNYEQIQQ
jgi:hypothetical protein